MELIQASLAGANLIFTIPLVLIGLYWFSVIIGAIGMDSIEFDMDLDVDVDVDVDLDLDVDADVDVDADGGDIKGGGASASESFAIGILRFFNFGRIPFMVLISFIFIFGWALSVWCNNPDSWVNPNGSALVSALLFLPILISSLLITKVVTTPMVPVFEKFNTAAKDLVIEGRVGTLMTSIEDQKIGQLKIDIDGSIVSLSVKADAGQSLKKGQQVVVIEETKDGKAFLVQKFNHL